MQEIDTSHALHFFQNVAVVPPLSKKTTLHIPVPAKGSLPKKTLPKKWTLHEPIFNKVTSHFLVPTKVSESLPKKETSYVPLSSEANLHAPGDAPNKGTSRVYTSNKSTSYVSPSDEAHTPSHCEGATCAYHLKGKRDFIYRRTGSEHKTPHSELRKFHSKVGLLTRMLLF